MENTFNFSSTNKEILESGINFEKPTVIAVEESKNGTGFNALIVQELKDVPVGVKAKEGKELSDFGRAARNASYIRSTGKANVFLARTLEYFSKEEEPVVGQIFEDLTIIILDTHAVDDHIDNGKLEQAVTKRQNKDSIPYTIDGKEIYRGFYLMPSDSNFEHIVLKADRIETSIENEIMEQASKMEVK